MSTTHRAPRGRPVVSLAALLVALAIIALAVVAVRDLVVARGWAPGTPWARSLVEGLDGLGATTASTAVGVAMAVLGAVLLLVAVKPAPRTHRALPADAEQASVELWATPAATAALALDVADRTCGVLGARVRRAGRRRVRLEVGTTLDRVEIRERVTTRLREELAPLGDPRVVVKVREDVR
ncbi:DUF6286 domain-containing protein [Nocardioides acrostichi]|uniref:DUF6286 domain-containing protein n=1 Tax=Nocardioides acrostichi TaxID=2784339 RepID=A0A930Y763_9ACTN|nr:DUF6286 domain-containing protein [Nocardioides acrostichi]MBF4161661.1 hypothetical protein [Nocardioides acrostichi]